LIDLSTGHHDEKAAQKKARGQVRFHRGRDDAIDDFSQRQGMVQLMIAKSSCSSELVGSAACGIVNCLFCESPAVETGPQFGLVFFAVCWIVEIS